MLAVGKRRVNTDRRTSGKKRSQKDVAFWSFMAVSLLLIVVGVAYEQGRGKTTATAEPAPPAVLAPVVVELPPLVAPPGSKSVIFGDSWTVGYAANPQAKGYAYLAGAALEWDNEVDGASGTGYLNPGNEGRGTYLDRLRGRDIDPDMQVVVIQGGLNDADKEFADFPDAAGAVLAEAKVKFPNAQIIVLGPAPAELPVWTVLTNIDYALQDAASDAGAYFISAIVGLWITPSNYDEVIDATKSNHPSTAGHALLGERVTAAIRELE